MAVHFDFVMEDIDAENMMRAIHSHACTFSDSIFNVMGDTTKSEEYRESMIASLKTGQSYYLDLIEQMKNTMVT